MKRSLIIVICLALCALLVLSGCDESLRAEVEEEYGTSGASDAAIAVAEADDPGMTILDAAEAAESEKAGIEAAEVFSGKAMEKGEKGLIDYRKGAEAEEEEELISPKETEAEAYYGIRWDEPDEVEIETVPDGYDEINNRDDKLLASLDYPVFKAEDGEQMIAYGRVLDRYGRDTDECGWFVFVSENGFIFRDPTSAELKSTPVPEGFELIGEASDLPRCLGFGLYTEALDYEPGDAGEDDVDIETEKKNSLKADRSLIAPADDLIAPADDLIAPAGGRTFYAFADRYEDGEVAESGWFEVDVDMLGITEDTYETLLPGQILICQSDAEDFTYLTVGEDDRDIRKAVKDESLWGVFVATVWIGGDPNEEEINDPDGYEYMVDVPAYSYREPVYQTQWVSVCDDCGEVIEGLPEAHIAEEIEKGGTGSFHNEPRQVQIGEREVEVPAAGHYEKIG